MKKLPEVQAGVCWKKKNMLMAHLWSGLVERYYAMVP
jgi:hypothetical protein